MNIKKITAVLSLAAVMATSGSAFASMNYNTHPNNHSSWTYGTTGLFGGGTLKSEYYDTSYRVSYSSVRNSEGQTDSNTAIRNWANSSTVAHAFKTEHSYYNFWN